MSIDASSTASSALASGRAPRYEARTFFETTRLVGARFSHDETRLLVNSDATGVFNAYAYPVDGGAPKQLTFSEDDAHFGIGFFPADDRFLCTAAKGGDELDHLYLMHPDGRSVDLTPGEGLKADLKGWSGDLKHFYVVTNERDPKTMDLYRYSVADLSRERIFENPGGFTVNMVSPDGRWLCLKRYRDNLDDDLFLLDLQETGAEPVVVTAHEGSVEHASSGFTHDSRSLRYTSNAGSEFKRVWSYDIEAGEHRLEIEDEWDVNYALDSWHGRYRVSGVNADAHTRLTVLDQVSGQSLDLPDIPRAEIVSTTIARSETKLAYYTSGDTSPAELHVLDLESGGTRCLARALNPVVDEAHLVASEVVRYPSFDGLEIPALLYRPHGASAEAPVPAMLWIHGGPGGQSRAGYNPTLQFLINQGYAILSVNNRGSSGYGKTFFHLDDRRHGEGDLQDCVYGRRYLETLPWIDGARIGIMGGSYGGFMTAAALTFEPEVFEVGIDIFGVTNWLRTLRSIPSWWTDMKARLYAEMGDPAEDEERLRRISPLFHAHQVRRPLMVVQGANDPRVLQVESDELVAAVREAGVPVEYLIFDDEGHGFVKRENTIAAAEAYRDFLDRYL